MCAKMNPSGLLKNKRLISGFGLKTMDRIIAEGVQTIRDFMEMDVTTRLSS
jgi:hypothetical protein